MWFFANNHIWEKGKPDSLGERWNFVDRRTGRMDDATITHQEGEPWVLWKRGACYGHFNSFENAKRRVERFKW